MVTALILLAVLVLFFGVGFWITGALLSALIWVCIKLPVGIFLLVLGLAFCCTLILIPVGKVLVKTGFRLILPLV